MSHQNIVEGTDANFEEVVAKSELADEYAGKAKVVKVNVDNERQIAAAMGIRSIPTVALFNGGEVKDVVIGARPKGHFSAMLEKELN